MDRIRTKTWKDGWETIAITRVFERADGTLMWGIKHPSQRCEEVAVADAATSIEPLRRWLARMGVPEGRGHQILTWLLCGQDPELRPSLSAPRTPGMTAHRPRPDVRTPGPGIKKP